MTDNHSILRAAVASTTVTDVTVPAGLIRRLLNNRDVLVAKLAVSHIRLAAKETVYQAAWELIEDETWEGNPALMNRLERALVNLDEAFEDEDEG